MIVDAFFFSMAFVYMPPNIPSQGWLCKPQKVNQEVNRNISFARMAQEVNNVKTFSLIPETREVHQSNMD